MFVYANSGTYLYTHTKAHTWAYDWSPKSNHQEFRTFYIHICGYMFIYTYTGTCLYTLTQAHICAHDWKVLSQVIRVQNLLSIHTSTCLYAHRQVHTCAYDFYKKAHIEKYMYTHTYTVMYISNLILTLKCCRLFTVQKSISNINADFPYNSVIIYNFQILALFHKLLNGKSRVMIKAGWDHWHPALLRWLDQKELPWTVQSKSYLIRLI